MVISILVGYKMIVFISESISRSPSEESASISPNHQRGTWRFSYMATSLFEL
ncbi:MAG TPA: hypothetical protein VK633_13700 [Verrucomicrobiae bacterium]|nr:hypothetical protein [Verrucomicrobiae bacterium]